jgi:hypothetical protein
MVTRLKAPVSEVFSYIADFRTLQEYNPSIISVAAIGDGPPTVGSRCRITMSMFGRTIQPVLSITEMARDELIATRLHAFIPAIERRRFVASGNETEFHFTIEFSSKWPLVGRLVDAILAKLFAQRQAHTEVTLLEKHFNRRIDQSRQQEVDR